MNRREGWKGYTQKNREIKKFIPLAKITKAN